MRRHLTSCNATFSAFSLNAVNATLLAAAGLIALTAAASADEKIPQPSPAPAASPYVQRMMTLDRDRDGYLSAKELPGRLSELLKTSDQDGDQQLSSAELSAIEEQSLKRRNSAIEQTQPQGRRPGRGVSRDSSRTPTSPLDPAQILKFALTFDADHDGGLNASELQRYAKALAVRRSQGQGPLMTQESNGHKPAEHSSDGPSSENAALKRAPPRGLGADGKGAGGFGDPPGAGGQ